MSSVIQPVLSDFNIGPPELNSLFSEFVSLAFLGSTLVDFRLELGGGSLEVKAVPDQHVLEQIFTLAGPLELAQLELPGPTLVLRLGRLVLEVNSVVGNNLVIVVDVLDFLSELGVLDLLLPPLELFHVELLLLLLVVLLYL